MQNFEKFNIFILKHDIIKMASVRKDDLGYFVFHIMYVITYFIFYYIFYMLLYI